jgi:hypothetical protein
VAVRVRPVAPSFWRVGRVGRRHLPAKKAVSAKTGAHWFESNTLRQILKRIDMLKPTANYKMSSQTKAGLALGKFKDAHARGSWKRAMIQAELTAAIQPRREKAKRESAGE